MWHAVKRGSGNTQATISATSHADVAKASVTGVAKSYLPWSSAAALAAAAVEPIALALALALALVLVATSVAAQVHPVAAGFADIALHSLLPVALHSLLPAPRSWPLWDQPTGPPKLVLCFAVAAALELTAAAVHVPLPAVAAAAAAAAATVHVPLPWSLRLLVLQPL